MPNTGGWDLVPTYITELIYICLVLLPDKQIDITEFKDHVLV